MHGGWCAAPASVGEIFEIHFAVIGVEGTVVGRDHVKGLDDLIAVGSRDRCIVKADACRVGPFEIFTLMTDLRLECVRGCAVCGGCHAQDAVSVVDLNNPKKKHSRAGRKRRSRRANPAHRG